MRLIEILRENIQKHKTFTWVILLSYIVLNGCFGFPFSNELFPFDYEKGLMLIVGYGMIGTCFAGLLNRSKSFRVFVLTFFFTAVGMICRYLLEYGEVSNTMNFIPINIILFITVIPVYCMTVYWSIYKLETK